jgi:hypothetical protein
MFVFDASTLILTAKIGLLERFLDAIAMEVAIPAAVEAECCKGKKTLDALMIRKAIDQSKIRVKNVRNKKLVAKLQEDFNLDLGESEAIALAVQEKALLIGIDDKHGINACKLAGIPFTTAVAILVRSFDKGLLDHGDALTRLSALARVGRYRSSILEDARKRLERQP